MTDEQKSALEWLDMWIGIYGGQVMPITYAKEHASTLRTMLAEPRLPASLSDELVEKIWWAAGAHCMPSHRELAEHIVNIIRDHLTKPKTKTGRVAMMAEADERCVCRSGRDFDGAEFGPCAYCEREHDKARTRTSIIRDAARWRISQLRYPRLMDTPWGYFAIRDRHGYVDVGIQPHPVTKSTFINQCIMGRGKTAGEAIEGMFASLSAYVAEGVTLPDDIEAIRILFDESADG